MLLFSCLNKDSRQLKRRDKKKNHLPSAKKKRTDCNFIKSKKAAVRKQKKGSLVLLESEALKETWVVYLTYC
jgi:hypothetical protein